MYLKARPKPKSAVVKDGRIRCSSHLQWVRTRACSVPRCNRHQIEAAHVRLGLPAGEQGGTSVKPSDIWVIPLCARHHLLQHAMGEASFAKEAGINMVDIALACQRQSPHRHKWEQEE